MATPRFRAVLFDFFGTLTEAVSRGPWHGTVAHLLGVELGEYLLALDETYPTRASGAYGSARNSLGHVTRVLGVRPSRADFEQALAARRVAVWADTRLRPESVEVLAAVRARGLRTALVTDCSHELPEFLPYLAVAPLLETCVYSVQVGACKPAPTMYLTACARLGVDPADCLYIGDGGGSELTGALALGMTPIRLAAPDLDRHLVYNPDLNFRGPAVSCLTQLVGEGFLTTGAVSAAGSGR
jgi:putative hydrolase of the HAD superfamily